MKREKGREATLLDPPDVLCIECFSNIRAAYLERLSLSLWEIKFSGSRRSRESICSSDSLRMCYTKLLTGTFKPVAIESHRSWEAA